MARTHTLVLAIVCGSSLAAAAPPTVHPGAELKAQGDKAFDQREYVAALKFYEMSYAAEALPAIHYNRATALHSLRRAPEALDALERFVREAPADLKAKIPDLDGLVKEYQEEVATLTIRISPNVPGTRVLVNAVQMGTGLTEVRVNRGPSTIEVIADGYWPFSTTRDLPGAQTTTLVATLVSRTSELQVQSSLPGSTATIDGQGRGLLPLHLRLTPGDHRVRVDLEGYTPAETTVSLAPGLERRLVLDPTPRPLTSKWGFWLAIGAGVLVAGSLTYVAVTTERTPDQGQGFTPSEQKL